MENERKIVELYFFTEEEVTTHYHQNLDILYVIKGRMDVQIDDAKYRMNSGDFILVNANKRHTIYSKKGILGARFFIDFHMLAEYMGTMDLMFWCNTVTDKNDMYDRMRELLDRILDYYFEKDTNALHLNSLCYEMLYLLTGNFMVKVGDARLTTDSSLDRMRLKQIQNYIQSNYQSQISLNDLSEKLYLTNAYLSKYIKKHMGLSFSKYLNNVRLFHAMDELSYSNKSITRIALDNGFPTSAAFTKSFRDMHGESPSEYRKKIQMENAERLEANAVEGQQRFAEYLGYRKEEKEPEIKTEYQIRVDTRECLKRNATWKKAVNVGEAYLLLRSEVQKQLLEIHMETGVEYARIWNLFSNEHCFDERKGFNFRKLDLVLDFLVDNNMKPYIELGHKPNRFLYTAERVVMENEWNLYDYDIFCEMIRGFCLHMVNRYGLEEIEGWIFEYWNDPKLNMGEENGKYYSYFEVIHQTLKSFSAEIKLGGAGFILGYENSYCREVIEIWKKRKIHPDFLSFCSFQYIAITESGYCYGKKSLDEHYMEHQLIEIRQIMQEQKFVIPEIYIDEWNFTVSNRNVFNDSCRQGAYIMKTCIDMIGNADFMAYWHGMDAYSEYYDSDGVLFGDSGMISKDGIRKPAFYAFYFLNKLQPNVLKKDDFSVVTTNGRGQYVIACHNFKNLSTDYLFKEEDEIQVEQQEQFMENTDLLKLKFSIDHVENGCYHVRIYYINSENGNVQGIWKNLGYTKRLEKEEAAYMKKRAFPGMEVRTVQVENGTLEIENVLKPQEIRLLDINYRYSMAE
jgi:beta-xylosidase/AraC-like DNA-binding protein